MFEGTRVVYPGVCFALVVIPTLSHIPKCAIPRGACCFTASEIKLGRERLGTGLRFSSWLSMGDLGTRLLLLPQTVHP